MSSKIYTPTPQRDFFFANEGPCGHDWSKLQVNVEANEKVAFYVINTLGIQSESVVLDIPQQAQLMNILMSRSVAIPSANITTRKR